MKNRKRNIALLAVVMCVCAAVLLNWSYNNRWGKADSKMVAVEDAEIAEANATVQDRINSGYFAEARLTRQVSRDEALDARDADRKSLVGERFFRVCRVHRKRRRNSRCPCADRRFVRRGGRTDHRHHLRRNGI